MVDMRCSEEQEGCTHPILILALDASTPRGGIRKDEGDVLVSCISEETAFLGASVFIACEA